MPAVHELKCWPTYFDAISRNQKRFDVRRDDRGFQRGDYVVLKKWDNAKGDYVRDIVLDKPFEVQRRIKYILTGGQFGVEPGYVVLGF